MVKKVMALILSLAMIFSLTANFSVVMAAEEGVNVVSLKYYSDPDLSPEHEITSIGKGEVFYAALYLDKFTKLNAITLTVAYDSESVKLVDLSGNDVQINNEDPYIGTSSTGYKDGSLGIQQFNLSTQVKATVAGVVPASSVKDGKGLVSLVWLNTGNKTKSIDEPFNCAIFAFRAIKRGNATFSVPVKGLDTPYDSCNELGLSFNKVDGDDTDYYYRSDANIDFPAISITADQLPEPVVSYADGVISWQEVENASAYKVLISVSKNDGAPIYSEIFDVDKTQLSMNLPAAIENGDVSVSVMAMGDESQDIFGSDYSTPIEFVVTSELEAPSNVAWDGNKVTWDAVEGAEKYEVTLKLNGAVADGYPKNATANMLDVSTDLQTPAQGKNSYTASVKAIGDGTYVLNSAESQDSAAKNICGSVKPVTDVQWNGKKATWTERDDKANVAGYIVCLKRGGTVIYTTPDDELVSGNLIDLSGYMDEPGKYTFTVTAIGASTADGDYKDATPVPCQREAIVQKTLDAVTDLTWNERTLTWTDTNDGHTFAYQVTLYKGTEEIGTYVVTDTFIDFDEKGADIAAGTYKAEVIAKGDGMGETAIYLDSAKAESEKTFTARLADPTNVRWDGTNAVWDSVEHAYAYEIALYFNGVDTGIRRFAFEPLVAVDLGEDLVRPGEYTFTVKASANNGFSASRAIESENVYQNTEATTGNVYIEVYEDAECVTPATDVKVGDVFYVAVALENTASFMSFSSPIKFNPEYVKVVDANNVVLTDGIPEEGTIIANEDIISLVENEGEDDESIPYVDNTNGLIKIAGTTGSAIEITEKTIIVVVKMMAVGKSDANEFKFAVANKENPKSYDVSSMSGFEMANTTGLVFANDQTPVTVAIAKGQIAKPQAPVWDGSTLTWNKAEGNSVTGYEIELYRDGTLVNTIVVNDKNATEESLASYTTTSGTYTAKIKVLADGIGADSSELSDASEEYVVASRGGGRRPKKETTVVTPVTPVTPVKPEFTDIAGHWAEKDIIELADLGIVDGYGDNTYRPDLGITRAEFTKLMVTCLGAELKGEAHVYGDTENHWAKDYIAIGTELGIVNGIGDNLFAPDEIITREQIAAVIYRMAGKPEVAVSTFADRADVTEYAKTAVDYVAANGIMIGFEDNTFRGQEKTNRAQMATVTLRLYKANFFANYKN